MEMRVDNDRKEMEIKNMKEQEEKLSHSVSGRSSILGFIGIAVLIILAFVIYIVIASQKISNLKATIENERAMNFNKFQKPGPGNRSNFGY
ncbi:MAG TPA: hypothetical protein VFJ43_13570 [Bacteroidia bacterium]|nr:hypothetical protein [Bacteroidia bacterium]